MRFGYGLSRIMKCSSILLCRRTVGDFYIPFTDTDATPDLAAGDVAALQREMRQRVRCLAPGKRILHDDELDPDELSRWIGDRHAEGFPVAVHCVTAAQLVVTLEALTNLAI